MAAVQLELEQARASPQLSQAMSMSQTEERPFSIHLTLRGMSN